MTVETTRSHRRAFLRGAGVTMALPWLESIPTFGAPASQSGSAYPKRFAALFMANGVNPDHWWGRETESGLELGKSLKPLDPIRKKVNVIHGLFNKNATGVGVHPGQTGNILSGVSLQKGAVIRGGVSVDQEVARRFEDQTIQPSLVLGCEKSNPSVHKNYSMLYSSHISWSSPTTPTPLEVYPALAFDRLFKDSTSAGDRSVLDAILDDARDLRRTISSSDQHKFDEYLNSVRDVEQRIELLRQHANGGKLQ